VKAVELAANLDLMGLRRARNELVRILFVREIPEMFKQQGGRAAVGPERTRSERSWTGRALSPRPICV